MKDFLINQSKENNISFHMPGHKGPGIYKKYGFSDFLDRMMECDITEIKGADNLHQPEGIIKDIEERYRRLYGIKKSHILVNGTSCGIVAAILATVKRGGQLIMSRGCHRSVYSGLVLGGITPCYVQPEVTKEEIMGALNPNQIAKVLDENPKAEAVILPSPNYYGICSDIKRIAEEVHKRGKILIVDQAHGAHLQLFEKFCGSNSKVHNQKKLSNLPAGAEALGADIVINSTHKTLATFTQTAILNVVSDRVDDFQLTSYLHMVQSTSPSYLLMVSHDINSRIIEEHGCEIFNSWMDDLKWFYGQANKRFEGLVVTWDGLDFTKINIDASYIGYSGSEMEDYLIENGIVPEMVTENIVVAMSGMGSVRSDYEKLAQVLEYAYQTSESQVERLKVVGSTENMADQDKTGAVWPVTGVIDHGDKVIEKNLADCIGYASGDLLIPYPPGIPVLCPGEEVTQEIIDYIENLTGENRQVLGLSDTGKIHVYE